MARNDRLEEPVSTRLTSTYTAAAGKKFGLTVGAAFMALAVVARWRSHSATSVILGAAGLLLVASGAAVPARLGPVDRAWMRVAHLISRVTTPVFMGVVYFAILTPVGVVRRVFSESPLARRAGATGYWVDRGESTRSRLDRQF
ncbi:MAG: hypothetical protein ABJF01_22990 [bacterium]